MSGPEHYAEAERLLKGHADALVLLDAMTKERSVDSVALDMESIGKLLVAAQVHATLALAAASLVDSLDPVYSDAEAARRSSWAEVL